MNQKLISVVIPAFNEEDFLSNTLASINQARTFLSEAESVAAEIIVVDNDSSDATADIARRLGATVARETRHNIAKVRNTGAKLSRGDILVFVDADTTVPAELLTSIVDAMSDENCLGGALDTDYRPMKLTVQAYLKFWRIIGRLAGMAQGATQFCRRDVFFTLRGYDETLLMGEDVDFYWRLKKLAKRQNGSVSFIDHLSVVPSTRRFDQWRLWRTLVWTNPLFILMFRRSATCWRGWYKSLPR